MSELLYRNKDGSQKFELNLIKNLSNYLNDAFNNKHANSKQYYMIYFDII